MIFFSSHIPNCQSTGSAMIRTLFSGPAVAVLMLQSELTTFWLVWQNTCIKLIAHSYSYFPTHRTGSTTYTSVNRNSFQINSIFLRKCGKIIGIPNEYLKLINILFLVKTYDCTQTYNPFVIHQNQFQNWTVEFFLGFNVLKLSS